MKKVWKNSKSWQFAVNLSELWKILEFQPKINIVSHSRSPQNLIESVEDLENPTTINSLNYSRSRQFAENVWELETISRSRKTIFRKFAWKNLIFEPNLTAIHLKSFTFQNTQYFQKLLSEMVISAVNFNFIVIFGNIFCCSHIPILFLALHRRGIFIMALLKTSNTQIFDLRGW